MLNPAKSKIGLISKQLLEDITSAVKLKLQINQWRQTANVIDWFKKIRDKKECKFLQLDIAEFYPSISEELLNEAICFAESFTNISSQARKIIHHSRKSLLFNGETTWVKKNNPEFDVTMGAYDGAEVCELVGLFLLSKVKASFRDLDFGLYRDDGLGYTRKLSGPKIDRMRKDIIKLFQSYGLKIEITCNLHHVDFLDVSFDLRSGKYSPFRKPNDTPLYIHRKSNHPPSIIKQLPSMISERISSNSCDVSEFEKVKDVYNSSLEKSGYTELITYKQPQALNGNKQKRKRNVIWFNPPYNSSVKSNIGKTFLKILSKHFPAGHRYHSIFNRNKVKLSYSCTPNISHTISSHNKRILSSSKPTAKPVSASNCNCRNTNECPLEKNCLEECLIYKATVSSDEGMKQYIGSTEASFKARFTQHKASLLNAGKSSATALSKHVWDLKTRSVPYEIKWKIVAKCQPYRCGTRRCGLCIEEKYHILNGDKMCLNRNSELLQKCRHSNKHKLVKVFSFD